MRKVKKVCIMAMFLLLAFAAPENIYGAPGPEVHAAAYILIEMESGRILSQEQAHRRMFPAATTRILTAILAYEHIGPDEIVVVGNEINYLPGDSARNWHQLNEAITGTNLLRSMLVGAGSDAANTVVIEVMRRVSGDENISFPNAQARFASLMTQRAGELGALDSHFMNAHGSHHDNHFTTAYDMAQISRHALSIPALAEILALPSFSGLMCGGGEVPQGATSGVSRPWTSPNALLHENNEFFYPYAIGLRTGMTNQAGESLAAAAVRDGITLISVTFNSPLIPGYEEGEYVPTRWQDNINLFEYGFANYAHRVFLAENTIIGELPVYDPRIDDPGTLEFFSTSEGMLFLSRAEMNRLQREVEIEPDFLTYTEEYGRMFVAPIYENDAIGTISYFLDGEMVFTAAIYAARYVPVRTAASDIEIRMERINEIFFSRASIPFWIAGVSVLALIIVLIVLARRAAKRKRNNYKYKWKY